MVAEDSSGVIAHVVLSWVGVEGGSRTRILNLTPMSVRPDRQRMGVGTRLIWDALGRATEAGEPAVVVARPTGAGSGTGGATGTTGGAATGPSLNGLQGLIGGAH